MRKLFLVAAVAMSAPLFAQTNVITLPAAASIVGGAPFFSDVRAFNTSYSQALSVTATYRCFLEGAGGSCTAGTSVVTFALAPRESKALNDIVARTFLAPNTAGGVEFSFGGESEQLVVTSRLYSTAPTPTVGMFIPGLSSSDAHANTVLTSVRNGGPGAGFRTNVGLFNPGDSPVSVTFAIVDGANSPIGNPVPVPGGVGAHAGAQINGIFAQAGAGTADADDAAIVVTSTGPVFTYAAVIDNNTTDPIFVVGAPDQVSATTHSTHIVHVGPNGQTIFVDDQSGTSVTTIRVGDTVNWVWETLTHGVDAGTCSGGGGGGYYGTASCDPSGDFSLGVHQAPFSMTRTFDTAGTFPYFCDVHQSAMTGRIVVQTAAAPSRRARRAATR
jgi:plastocyanin